MKNTLLSLFFLSSLSLFAQNDSLLIRKIFDEALTNGKSYEDLRSLCKDVGARLTGSAEAQMAIDWGFLKMKEYGFDKVYLQEIEVPHWERGTKEAGWIKKENGSLIKVDMLALGGSIGTNGTLEADLIMFESLDELKKASEKDVKGKIVFLNEPMDATQINTFKAYGHCWPIRGHGATEASKLGAKGVIIRSLGLAIDEFPHTGSMHYADSIEKIPAAAISTKDAELLSTLLNGKQASFVMEMDCRTYPPVKSYNVIGELTGSKNPDEIITVGGHLDSWDAGEGAHDDGAGIIHSLEALRLLKELGIKPIHTIRVVFFMNEENGNKGGKSYAQIASEKKEKHIAAVESDRGGFTPRGFSCDGDAEKIKMIQSYEPFFRPYDLHLFEKGYGGVDISPLHDYYPEIPLFGFIPDSQRYFDFHHTGNDVFENVNKRELELGCASIAAFLYLLDKSLYTVEDSYIPAGTK